MTSSDGSTQLTLREREPDATAGYDVHRDEAVIGSVRPFQMGAGRSGRGWLAEDPDVARSTGFRSRDEASEWFVERMRQ